MLSEKSFSNWRRIVWGGQDTWKWNGELQRRYVHFDINNIAPAHWGWGMKGIHGHLNKFLVSKNTFIHVWYVQSNEEGKFHLMHFRLKDLHFYRLILYLYVWELISNIINFCNQLEKWSLKLISISTRKGAQFFVFFTCSCSEIKSLSVKYLCSG